jgi:hypothetical protein
MYDWVDANALLGKTLTSVKRVGDEQIEFRTTDGETYRMFHSQDCCESVRIEDVCGNLDDLVGSPLLMAEESTNRTDDPPEEYYESYTWTFYRFATVKGSVTIRWYGESNGYYSESVDIIRIE